MHHWSLEILLDHHPIKIFIDFEAYVYYKDLLLVHISFFNKFHIVPYRDVFWVLIVEMPFLWPAGLDHLDFDHLFSMLGNIRRTWRLLKAVPFLVITNYVLLLFVLMYDTLIVKKWFEVIQLWVWLVDVKCVRLVSMFTMRHIFILVKYGIVFWME